MGLSDDALTKLVGESETELSQSLTAASPEAAPGSTLGRTLSRTAGGVLGGSGGAILGGMAGGIGAIPGAIAGAGLGTAGGDLAYDMATGQRRSVPQQAVQTGGAMLEGAQSEMLGRGLGGIPRALGLSRTITPEQQAAKAGFEKFGIPYMASDVTGSRAMARIENIPSFFAIGVGPLQRHAVKSIHAAEGALGKEVRALGPAADDIAAGIAAQGSVKQAVKQFRNERAVLFDRIQQMAGDEAVIPTTKTLKMAEGLIDKAQTGVLSVTRGAEKAAAIASAGTTGALPGGERMNVSGLPAHIQELLGAAQAGKITFAQSRQLETELGQLAFPKGAPPLVNVSLGRLRALYGAVRDDQTEWLKQPAQGAVNTALAEAKQTAAMGTELFNNSMRSLVLGKTVRPEAVVNRVFRPGALTDTLDFKLAVTDDVWQKAQAAWLAGLYDKARTLKSTTGGGEEMLSPAKFVSALRPYIGTGQLEAILGPESATRMVELWKTVAKMGRSEMLAGNPSGTGGALLSTGQFGALFGAAFQAGRGDLVGATAAATTALAPYPLAKAVTSETGKRLGIEGLTGKYTRPALRFAAHVLGNADE